MRLPPLDPCGSQIGCSARAATAGADCRSGEGASRVAKASPLYFASLLTLTASLCGCTSFQGYVHNGFKVGPNYDRPPVPVAADWIDSSDARVRKTSEDLSTWWQVFKDPALDSLIGSAYQQNLPLREAGTRVLQARAQVGIAVGNFFPQTQQMKGEYAWNAISTEVANRALAQVGTPTGGTLKRFSGEWDYGFSLAWELDFWGRFRRAIESATASLDASVENYDAVLVTLLGDVATYYVQVRTFQQRIEYARANVQIQRETLRIAEGRFKAGTTGELDVDQARSTLAQTEATIPALEISLRQANNQLCVLLGIPPEDLQRTIGPAPIPGAPADVAVGVPVELIRRRPDVRQAERLVAAQSAQIGVAEAALYPHVSIASETPLMFGYSAEFFKNLFKPTAMVGSIGPSFTWDILNYGRLLDNVHAQEAGFQNLVATYQNTVLTAQQDVENGLVTFLKSQEEARFQAENVKYAEKAVKVALAQYQAGTIDFTRVTQLEQTLVTAQDLLAQAQGQIALGLIQTYRALGGGWELGHPQHGGGKAVRVTATLQGLAPLTADEEQ
jgi:NodT family efflux transporter outer membrane factor (OMF) lipoprotein